MICYFFFKVLTIIITLLIGFYSWKVDFLENPTFSLDSDLMCFKLLADDNTDNTAERLHNTLLLVFPQQIHR